MARVLLHPSSGSKGTYYNAAEKSAPTTRGRRFVSWPNGADSALTYAGVDLPSNYSSGLTLYAVVSCPTAGNVQMLARVMATADAEDAETDNFGSELLGSSTALTADLKETLSIDISSGVSASDTVWVIAGRNTGISGDVADKVKVWSAWLEYTTA